MRFRTKVDAWIVAAVLFGPAVVLVVSILTMMAALLLAIALVALILGLLAWPCDYSLKSDELLIRCGLLIKWRVPYRDITSVERTRNPLSSPAWSLDRLMITYRGKHVMISPADQREFMAELEWRAGLGQSEKGLSRNP